VLCSSFGAANDQAISIFRRNKRPVGHTSIGSTIRMDRLEREEEKREKKIHVQVSLELDDNDSVPFGSLRLSPRKKKSDGPFR